MFLYTETVNINWIQINSMCDFLETPYYIMCEFSKVCIFYFEQVKDNYLDVGKLFHILHLRFNFFIFDSMFSLTYGMLPTVC